MPGITLFKKHESLTEGHLISFCGLFNHLMVWTLQLVEVQLVTQYFIIGNEGEDSLGFNIAPSYVK